MTYRDWTLITQDEPGKGACYNLLVKGLLIKAEFEDQNQLFLFVDHVFESR